MILDKIQNLGSDGVSSISLFGPGVGESVCLHLGNGDWFVIDSCRDPKTKRPAALLFLEEQGLDPAEVVKGIVVSHWHDDHVRGMSEVVRSCPHAQVFLSVALQRAELYELANIYSGRSTPVQTTDTGVTELQKVFSILTPRVKEAKDRNIEMPYSFVGPNSLLYRRDRVEVWALSPSQGEIAAALDDFTSHLDEARRRPRIIPRPTSNFCAIALHVRFNDAATAILGADLETSKTNPLIGWDAVVNSRLRPESKARFVKIPHHGSETGHHPKFWTELTEGDPVGILTEFSSHSLPREQDVRRLKSLTSALYCTTAPKASLPKRNKTVEKTMSGVVRSRRVIGSSRLGQVTLSIAEDGSHRVDLGSNAVEL
jgi:beta-lactamase superfamily II metal-dependent hydrolase